MKAEYFGDKGCLQRDNAEREEYAGARSIGKREAGETDGAELLERILDRDNLNRAYKRVKANKGDTSTNRQHEEHDGEMGWMAAATFPNVHLEAVEEAQNTHRKRRLPRYEQ